MWDPKVYSRTRSLIEYVVWRLVNTVLAHRRRSWSPSTPFCKLKTSVLPSLQHDNVWPTCAGPHAWNLLPENVRKSTFIAIFKRSLKTFLFEQITHSAHQRRSIFHLMGCTCILSDSISKVHCRRCRRWPVSYTHLTLPTIYSV